ncbi:MAG: hypothetical protein HZA61_06955 [Candidatus Eisenbacteria bacterium]|uniref:Uncharacterized protein n=1 Tax=Eiseniibacteriota bacterium TaxID=2212470 RepID=A0A933W1M6_UNCEI|nr:hypothetical protein [Candidatus Eisenbacteria bacterium]
MRRLLRVVVLVASFVLVPAAPAVAGERAPLEIRSAADARALLLACDSATVMLEVATSEDVHVAPDGTRHSLGSAEILAFGSNGAAWVRRFADALLPEGWQWKARMSPEPVLDRTDGRDPWVVRVSTFSHGEVRAFWRVNLLDGWAGMGLGTGTSFDISTRADSLRAVLASGMSAYPDAARRLRKLREPDATIQPLPERLRR